MTTGKVSDTLPILPKTLVTTVVSLSFFATGILGRFSTRSVEGKVGGEAERSTGGTSTWEGRRGEERGERGVERWGGSFKSSFNKC